MPTSRAERRIDLSIVIPSYNEEARLPKTLERITSYLDQQSIEAETLVVDDGSQDATTPVTEQFSERGVRAIRYPDNQGKGTAVRTGVLASRGQRVLITDADLSTPIEDLSKLQSHLGSAEIVIGSRALEDSNVTAHQPLYRELMGKAFNKLLWALGVRGIRDTQCGFKLLRGKVARELFADMVTPGFAFDVELLWLARRRGYRIAEVGVTWVNSPVTRVNPLLDPPRMVLEILRFRWTHRREAERTHG